MNDERPEGVDSTVRVYLLLFFVVFAVMIFQAARDVGQLERRVSALETRK